MKEYVDQKAAQVEAKKRLKLLQEDLHRLQESALERRARELEVPDVAGERIPALDEVSIGSGERSVAVILATEDLMRGLGEATLMTYGACT